MVTLLELSTVECVHKSCNNPTTPAPVSEVEEDVCVIFSSTTASTLMAYHNLILLDLFEIVFNTRGDFNNFCEVRVVCLSFSFDVDDARFYLISPEEDAMMLLDLAEHQFAAPTVPGITLLDLKVAFRNLTEAAKLS